MDKNVSRKHVNLQYHHEGGWISLNLYPFKGTANGHLPADDSWGKKKSV